MQLDNCFKSQDAHLSQETRIRKMNQKINSIFFSQKQTPDLKKK